MNNSDSDSDPEGEHDTRYGTPSPTRDTRQSETHYEQSFSEEGESDENEDDSPTRDTRQSETHYEQSSSEDERDTRYGTPSPTRDTRQSETHYERSSSEDEGEGRDKNGDDSPFRDDEDSPTNQSPTDSDEEDEDLVSTEKRRLRQIATEQDSEERARLLEELYDMINERRERSEPDW